MSPKGRKARKVPQDSQQLEQEAEAQVQEAKANAQEAKDQLTEATTQVRDVEEKAKKEKAQETQEKEPGEKEGPKYPRQQHEVELFSWVAGSFGDCYEMNEKDTHGRWFRDVTCRLFYDGSEVLDEHCEGRPRPLEWDVCFCEFIACEPSSLAPVKPVEDSVSVFRESVVETDLAADDDFEIIGCFPKDDDDDEIGIDDELYDFKCVHYDGPGSCRSGLPFYRFISNQQTPAVCFEFCIGKGLDLFGLVDGHECRCGASILNAVAWHLKPPRENLLPAYAKMLLERDAECPVRIYRYIGHYEAGGVPVVLTSPGMSDIKYFESIATGKLLGDNLEDLTGVGPEGTPPANAAAAKSDDMKPSQEEDPDYDPKLFISLLEAAGAVDDTLVEDAEDDAMNMASDASKKKSRRRSAKKKNKLMDKGAGFARKCDQKPGTEGCTGAKRWNIFPTNTAPKGLSKGVKKWPVYYRVPYVFDTKQPEGHKFHVDKKRKEAFRAAAKVWREQTCIHWVEFKKPPTKKSSYKGYYVEVLVEDLESCYASHGVKPNMKLKSYVNLGWCCTMEELGNMVHEIGHVMGMDHEHSRPDSLKKYHGHGPYWKLTGEADDPSQWVLSNKAYTGSAKDSNGDKVTGYNTYDLESIMHYPLDDPWGKIGETLIPKGMGKATGQRKHLSKGDLSQVIDMYQCNAPNNRAVKASGDTKKARSDKRKRRKSNKQRRRRR